MKEMIFSLMSMEDRASALVLASMIDLMLERAILTRFIRLGKEKRDAIFRNPNAPLSSLSAKISVASALGCIGGEPRSQLERIRSIRNAFAHTVVGVTFDTPLISKECDKLNPQALLEGAEYESEIGSKKERFIIVGIMIAIILMAQIKHSIDQKKYGVSWSAPSIDKCEWPPRI
jgi:spore coat polysaccharide biosynthesis protein SpsF (cytidylyltransferase family)